MSYVIPGNLSCELFLINYFQVLRHNRLFDFTLPGNELLQYNITFNTFRTINLHRIDWYSVPSTFSKRIVVVGELEGGIKLSNDLLQEFSLEPVRSGTFRVQLLQLDIVQHKTSKCEFVMQIISLTEKNPYQ